MGDWRGHHSSAVCGHEVYVPRDSWWVLRDSNAHWTASKAVASAGWAKDPNITARNALRRVRGDQ